MSALPNLLFLRPIEITLSDPPDLHFHRRADVAGSFLPNLLNTPPSFRGLGRGEGDLIREVVDEEKEGTKDAVSTEDVVSTDKEKVSTDRSKVSTDRSKDSTDKEEEGTDKDKDSTDKEEEGTDKDKDSTVKEEEGTKKDRDSTVSLDEGTDDRTEARSTTSITSTTTPTMFGDDETIAQVLVNMSQAKAVSREKEKGVELKDEDESDTESDDIPEAEKKFKQLARDEEMAIKFQEDWETEEEKKD
ncbi:hypothetical protein Tco_1212280 [Tanacetum coccineum]